MLEHSPLQSNQINAAGKTITGRRVLFAILFMLSMAGSLTLAAVALSPGGFSATDVALLVLFAITLPWMVAGFWNSVIGFLIMRFSSDPIAAVMPPWPRTSAGTNQYLQRRRFCSAFAMSGRSESSATLSRCWLASVRPASAATFISLC